MSFADRCRRALFVVLVATLSVALPAIPRLPSGTTPAAATGGGAYWLVSADGHTYRFGAPDFGSMAGAHLNQPVVCMTSTPAGGGYWMVARDGGVFAFGDAGFAGSAAAITLNQPIVGMAAPSAADGYWLGAPPRGGFRLRRPPLLRPAGGPPA